MYQNPRSRTAASVSLPITAMSASETLAGGTDPSSSPADGWTESDELHVLRAVLEIALEPAAEFDPRVSLFARIGRNLSRPFSRAEILAKVKELRRRHDEGGHGAHGEGVELSCRVWGPAVSKRDAAAVSKKRPRKPMGKWRRKKKKKVSLEKLLSTTDKQLENDSHPLKHFLAITTLLRGEKYLSSSSPSHFVTNKSGKLTDNVDLMTLKQSSGLVLAALNDDNQKHYEQHEEQPMDRSNHYQVLIDTPGQHQQLMSVDQETPACAHEAYGQTLLVESSCGVAQQQLSMALEACTNDKARAQASSALSSHIDDRDQSNSNSGPLGMNKSVSDPVRHEYPKIQQNHASDWAWIPNVLRHHVDRLQ